MYTMQMTEGRVVSQSYYTLSAESHAAFRLMQHKRTRVDKPGGSANPVEPEGTRSSRITDREYENHATSATIRYLCELMDNRRFVPKNTCRHKIWLLPGPPYEFMYVSVLRNWRRAHSMIRDAEHRYEISMKTAYNSPTDVRIDTFVSMYEALVCGASHGTTLLSRLAQNLPSI